MPSGWVVKPFGEVVSTVKGKKPKDNGPPTKKCTVPYINIKAFESGEPEQYASPGNYPKCSESDVLMVWDGARSGLVGRGVSGYIGSTLAKLEADGVISSYLYYFLQGQYGYINTNTKGVGIPHVDPAVLKAIPFPVAPPDQQERIVAEIEKQFSRLDEAVASLKRVKANLKRYQAAVLKAAVEGKLTEEWRKQNPGAGVSIDLFEPKNASSQKKKRAGRLWGSGSVPELTKEERAAVPPSWGWIKVGQLGLTVEDAVQVGPMSMKSKDFRETGLPVLNVGCVQWGFIDESKANFMPLGKVGSFKRYQIRKDDILFTRSGTVGRSAIAREEHDGWLMTFHLLRVRLDQRKCLPEYLRAVFEGAEHIKRQTRHGSIGSTRAGFNTKLLASLDVPLPSLDEQRTILAESSTMLSNIEVLDVSVSSQLKRAVALRQSILSRAFSGELELTAVGMNAEVLST